MINDQTLASDAERDLVIDMLINAAATGRLNETETNDRTTAALSARTRGELAALLADLPPHRTASSIELLADDLIAEARRRGLDRATLTMYLLARC